MSTRSRVALFVALTLAVAAAVVVYVVRDRERYETTYAAPPKAETTPISGIDENGPRIVFRHTGLDNRYGEVAVVSLDDPGGPRAFTGVTCDRVDATPTETSCLVTERGVVTAFEGRLYDTDWKETGHFGLAGSPSRTRLSPDGSLVATTSFVAGHSYLTAGFSTATEIRRTGGSSVGNLERFALVIDGRTVRPVDRNIWGVTFLDDDRFFATVGTGGQTYLVEGSVADRTLTSRWTNAECPSISPDGQRVAFKVDIDPSKGKTWQLAVLDLQTDTLARLSGRTRGLDDQVAWLDDDTLLYGLARADEPGVTDVWSIDATPGADPQVLIEQAWSPAVVRPS